MSEYLTGKTLKMIANGLTEDGILTPKKTNHWTGGVIKSILTNEKIQGRCASAKDLHIRLHQQKIEEKQR